jgi:small subunit ribosomal protein S16
LTVPETKGPASVAVKIRLLRVGKAKQPSYRVVVADARSPRDGRIIETIGHYGPRAEPSTVDINAERALAWLRQGAQPTEQVQKLLTTTGIWSTFASEKRQPIVTKLNRRGFATGKVAAPAKAPAPERTSPEKAAPEKAAPEKGAPASEDTAPEAEPTLTPETESAPDADRDGADGGSEETAS